MARKLYPSDILIAIAERRSWWRLVVGTKDSEAIDVDDEATVMVVEEA